MSIHELLGNQSAYPVTCRRGRSGTPKAARLGSSYLTLKTWPVMQDVGSRGSSSCTTSAVAEQLSTSGAGSQFHQPAGQGLGFYTGDDGFLYCDSLRIDDARAKVRAAVSVTQNGTD